MAYSTFTGRDGQQAAFQWVTQKIGGVDATVLCLDIGGAPASSTNPVPVTAPSPLPVSGTVGISGTVPVSGSVALSGTSPVSVAGTVSTLTPADIVALSVGGATVGTSTATLIAANGSRKRVDVSNGSTTAGIWIRPGAGTAVVGQGWYLPPQAQASYYTTLILVAISGTAGVTVGLVEW